MSQSVRSDASVGSGRGMASVGLALGAAFLLAPLARGATLAVPREFLTIQDAIDAASDGDVILAESGSYPEHVDFEGKRITLRSRTGAGSTRIRTVRIGSGEPEGTVLGGFTVTDVLDILGGASPTIRDCQFDASEGVVDVNGGHGSIDDSTPVFRRCSIFNGQAIVGGGFEVRNGASAEFIDCVFRDNHAEGAGGALIVDDSSTVILMRTVFRDNTAAEGGAIASEGEARIRHSRFKRNEATGAHGGAISQGDGDLHIESCWFEANTASGFGGGIYNGDGSVEVSKCRFEENRAGDGGGIFDDDGEAVLEKCTFVGNTARRDGGGVYGDTASTMSMRMCFIRRNEADGNGGGVYNESGSLMTIEKTQIVHNVAGSAGGGLFNGGGLVVVKSVIRANEPDNCFSAPGGTGCP